VHGIDMAHTFASSTNWGWHLELLWHHAHAGRTVFIIGSTY
jgi:hypothetical protein